jgi:hypothetical protein
MGAGRTSSGITETPTGIDPRRQTWERIFDDLFADYDEVVDTFARRQMRERNKAA